MNEDIFEKSIKLTNMIKISLEQGKNIKEWNDNNLISLINDCINIENNIGEIDTINKNVIKCKSNKNILIKFSPQENEINSFLETIKLFGKIYDNSFKYTFKKCPENIEKNKKYVVSGEKRNIITKTEGDSWVGIICENNLEELKEYKWKIKFLKFKYVYIIFGVAPTDFDINSSSFENYGWYLYCHRDNLCSKLISGPPYNYSYKVTNLDVAKKEIIVIMNMNKRTLKFIIDNVDKGESYTDIPIDKPIAPVIFLYYSNDSVEFIDL